MVLSCVIHGGVFIVHMCIYVYRSMCTYIYIYIYMKIPQIAGTYLVEMSFFGENVRNLGACNSYKEFFVRYRTLFRWLQL
jgi:hypothetical protein